MKIRTEVIKEKKFQKKAKLNEKKKTKELLPLSKKVKSKKIIYLYFIC